MKGGGGGGSGIKQKASVFDFAYFILFSSSSHIGICESIYEME